MSPDGQFGKIKSREDLAEHRQAILARHDPNKPCLAVCAGTGCQAYGVNKVIDALQAELDRRGLADRVDILATGCPGFCERGPLLTVKPQGIFYQRIQVKDVPEIVEETLVNGRVVERLLYQDAKTGEKIVHEQDVPFYKLQKRDILWMNGMLDPTRIEDYIVLGGYGALVEALYNLDEIVKVEGVDVFFIGPSDLSQSMGFPGQTDAPEVQAAMTAAFRAITLAGRLPGSAGNAQAVKRYLDQECLYVYTHLTRLLAAGSAEFMRAVGNCSGQQIF